MSRLYIITKSDIRKGTGKGCSERASTQINWGSAGDSKRVASLDVFWEKNSEFPEVTVTIGEEENPVKCQILKPGIVE